VEKGWEGKQAPVKRVAGVKRRPRALSKAASKREKRLKRRSKKGVSRPVKPVQELSSKRGGAIIHKREGISPRAEKVPRKGKSGSSKKKKKSYSGEESFSSGKNPVNGDRNRKLGHQTRKKKAAARGKKKGGGLGMGKKKTARYRTGKAHEIGLTVRTDGGVGRLLAAKMG